MLVVGIEFLQSSATQPGFSAKLVLNDNGAIFFPVQQQHRDMKGPSISYEDNYAGNALAAMIAPGRIEIRFHRDFSDQRVARIVSALLKEPGMAFMRDWQVTYQGRTLNPMP